MGGIKRNRDRDGLNIREMQVRVRVTSNRDA